MLLYSILSLSILFIGLTYSLQCFDCIQKLNISSTETITNGVDQCNQSVESQFGSCSQELKIEYEKNEVEVKFGRSESFEYPNLSNLLTNRTIIWLNNFHCQRIFQINCFDKTNCQTNQINQIYSQVKTFECSELWANLVVHLHGSPSNNPSLQCSNNDDKSLPCPNGTCLLIRNSFSSYSRKCLLNNLTENRFVLLIESKKISDDQFLSSLIYTCNKHLCNNKTMENQILDIIQNRFDFLNTFTTTTTTTTTTLKTTTSTGNRLNNIFLFIYIIYISIAF